MTDSNRLLRWLLCIGMLSWFVSCTEKHTIDSVSESPIYRNLDYLIGSLQIGEHNPSLRESQVSGYSKINFNPDSYEFHASLQFYNHPYVFFKGDPNAEYPNSNAGGILVDTPEENWNHYIHQNLINPLESLASLVMERDPHLRVRITSAFRTEGTFEYNRSLHHTGRALDLTVYDTYSKRKATEAYGLLADLCVDAGFDWVFYEDTLHIHTSVAYDPLYQPFLIRYKRSLFEWKPLEAYPLKDIGDYKAVTQLSLEPGTYIYKFAEGSPRIYYGFRDYQSEKEIGRLGRESDILPEKGYWGEPIVVTILEKGMYRFEFEPNIYQFTIKSLSGKKPPIFQDLYWFNGIESLLSEEG